MTSPNATPEGMVQKIRSIHPLAAMAAIAVTAVCLIAAVQFIAPRNAQSQGATDVPAAHGSAPGESVPAPPRAAAAPTAAPATAAASCPGCGEVVAVSAVKQAGEGSGLGVVAGGVLGGVVGNRFGAGNGKDAMTAVGIVGGALAGNQVEKQMKAKTLYRVEVRMEDGSLRTVTEPAPPGLAVGSKVRVSGNQIALR